MVYDIYGIEEFPIVKCANQRVRKRTKCYESLIRLLRAYLQYEQKWNKIVESNESPEYNYHYLEAYAAILENKLFDILAEAQWQTEWLRDFDRKRLDEKDFQTIRDDCLTIKSIEDAEITQEDVLEKAKPYLQ